MHRKVMVYVPMALQMSPTYPWREVYFVPTSASGEFPFRFSDGTIAQMKVKNGAIVNAVLIKGDQNLIDSRNKQLTEDPATGIIGELGFGTNFSFSGKDIQDEKILGTCHVATGRSDHLGGNLTPDLFNSRLNASHDDILYAPPKTPEISVTEVRMSKTVKALLSLEIFNLLHSFLIVCPASILSKNLFL